MVYKLRLELDRKREELTKSRRISQAEESDQEKTLGQENSWCTCGTQKSPLWQEVRENGMR